MNYYETHLAVSADLKNARERFDAVQTSRLDTDRRERAFWRREIDRLAILVSRFEKLPEACQIVSKLRYETRRSLEL
jgi:hypothetical protein